MERKRKYLRLEGNTGIILKFCNGQGEEEMPLSNVSAGGARVFLNREIEAGMSVKLNLKLPTDNNFFFVLGKIIRCERSLKKDNQGKCYFELGIKFLKMGIADRKNLIKYIYEHTDKQWWKA